MNTDILIIFTDGVAVPNPGSAGYGVVIQAADGKPITTISRSIGFGTNNQAEYHGLIAGLEKAIDLGAGSVDVRSDSQLMVRQISGQYRVKSPSLTPLYQQVVELKSRFKQFSIRHIPRELNQEADRLAGQSVNR